MQIRKSHIIGSIIAAAALVAGIAGAQTFDQTVNDTVKKDGSIVAQAKAEKQIMTVDPELAQAKEDLIEAQHGSHGGQGRGGQGHGGQGRGGQGDRRGGGHVDHGHDSHGHEGHGGHGRRDDGRDHHGRYGWGWDAWGRRQWLGWYVWNGVGSCRGWYGERRSFCYADCRAELNAGLDSPEDYQHCMQSCDYQYDTVWGPYWRVCRL